jgi:hypothetical protein
MDLTPLDFTHLPQLEQRLALIPSLFSEYSAANLYLFREVHQYKIEKRFSFIAGKDRKTRPILIPLIPFHLLSELPSTWGYFLEQGYSLYPLSLEQAMFIERRLPWDSEKDFDPDDSDYLFDRHHLATLAGRHLSAKRNHIHQLLNAYPEAHLEPLVGHEIPLLEPLLTRWSQAHQGLQTDNSSLIEALVHQKRLGLQGFVLKIDAKIIGLSLGEARALSWLFHFSRTDPAYKGATSYLYQQTALALPQAIDTLNMEQDMGLRGLRQAKHSFEPKEWLKKFRLKKKQAGWLSSNPVQ